MTSSVAIVRCLELEDIDALDSAQGGRTCIVAFENKKKALFYITHCSIRPRSSTLGLMPPPIPYPEPDAQSIRNAPLDQYILLGTKCTISQGDGDSN